MGFGVSGDSAVSEWIRDISPWKIVGVFIPLVIGMVIGYLGRIWRRYREQKAIDLGRRFETLEFAYMFVDTKGDKPRLIVKSLGGLPLESHIPNQTVRDHLLTYAWDTTKHESVIPMPGQLGSYVLKELHGLLKILAPRSGYDLKRWVMVAVFETYEELMFHQPVVLLVRPEDLELFCNFAKCREVQVYNGSDGSKLLTGMEICRKFKAQLERFNAAREAGKTTRHLEEMWVVELRLDLSFLEPDQFSKPFRSVPWERFASSLKALNLDSGSANGS